ncbi:MAG: hypothetical protein ACK4N5_16435, partial [Myxococcales bacterium]
VREDRLEDLPPMLLEMPSEHVAALARTDRGLLYVLSTTHLVPEQVWETSDAPGEERPWS